MTALTHWSPVMHICVSKLTIIGSDNGAAPGRRQAIIWTNAGILLIGPLGTNFSEIFIEIYIFSFKKMHLKMSSRNCWPCCLGLNVLTHIGILQSRIMIRHGSGMFMWDNIHLRIFLLPPNSLLIQDVNNCHSNIDILNNEAIGWVHYDSRIHQFLGLFYASSLIHCGLVMSYGDIGSGNCLLPDGTKPSPEPRLTYHQKGTAPFNYLKAIIVVFTTVVFTWYMLNMYCLHAYFCRVLPTCAWSEMT